MRYMHRKGKKGTMIGKEGEDVGVKRDIKLEWKREG